MRQLALVAVLLAAPAVAQAQEPPCPFPGQTPSLVVQLFFGQSIRGAALISRRAWARFVADTITPTLHSGFTITDSTGHYQDPDTHEIRFEPTELLVAVAVDTPQFRAGIAAIVDAFRRRFDQRAVGVVSTPGCAVF